MSDSTHKIIPNLSEALIVIKSLEGKLAAESTKNHNLRDSLERANAKIAHLLQEKEQRDVYFASTKNMMKKAR